MERKNDMEKMSRELRIAILKQGGKKALSEFNRKRRAPGADMNTGERFHEDRRRKKPKHPGRMWALEE